jgi:GNAT superfamily N-acetyltransferase
VEIARVTADELGAILPLYADYQRFYRTGPHDQRNRDFLSRFVDRSDEGALLAAWEDGAAVGFASLHWRLDSVEARPVAYLADLFVVEDRRGHGVGRALLEAAAAAAREHGYGWMVWETAPDNATARALYDRTGAEASTWVTYELRLDDAAPTTE